ncbi:hypothetical protein ACHCAI_001017 [Enterobacter asburiae]
MNNKELIKAGHALAKAISNDTPLIEIAKIVSNLATQLDVQLARSNQLSIELEVAEKRTAELQARDITIKQHAQALFEAIASPSDHYVPAYARCLREALNGTSTGKGE